MKCPHCRTAFNLDNARPDEVALGEDKDFIWRAGSVKCPDCERLIIHLFYGPPQTVQSGGGYSRRIDPDRLELRQVQPLGVVRPLSPDVPSTYADPFQRAVRVMSLAHDASAALSRRLLQDLIRQEAGITKRNLNDEIEALLESNVLPSDLAGDVDAVRTVGNFAAHPIKSQSTGQVVDVEPGEAEWLIEVLEELFDFYFVRPKERQRRRDKLNVKLTDAGTPELKGVS